MKIPFSVYDFFGYLACGFFFLCAIEFAVDGAWLLNAEDITKVQALFWAGSTYILGEIISSLASALFEHRWLRGKLGPAEETLWGDRTSEFWKKLFPNYYEKYSTTFMEAVENKAKSFVDVNDRHELYRHCYATVKKDKATLERLNIFLTQYGFARNVACALFLSTIVLLVGGAFSSGGLHQTKVFWAATTLLLGLALLTRYVKFYLLYTREVFDAYNV